MEFALLLPVLVVLCAGGVELGRALFIHAAIETAVRGGARLLALVPDPTCSPTCSWGAMDAIAVARDEIMSNTKLPGSAVTVMPVRTLVSGTVALRADVKVNFDLLAILGIEPSLTLSATHQEQAIED
ncbi:TadE/TadG family type IV pilus assembly protein [Bosea sp. PAMC 26642]|uniref:TadE/TadG family type IV pilus assembly protein n=1 Tax=Bosea sp. (strain PAMC 26642) TaxID=1792307 RepID=UPI00076FFDF2|nr:TadE/TadG family type IV pilus assembly protein [Bosea sp. PAMC 26642]AMJ62711.1 hypothetical protein AXW83_22570 [Bosea sp. PAMC 26642]